MKTRTGMLIGVLLAVPALVWSVEPAPPAKPDKPALQLQSSEVQKIIRTSAQTQIDVSAPATDAKAAEPLPTALLGEQTSIAFRAPRRPHHLKCDSFNCVAYSADEVALYSVPRDQFHDERTNGGDTSREWLSCQSRDNLLTTFERYDKCRGITIGLPPMTVGDTLIAVPRLSF